MGDASSTIEAGDGFRLTMAVPGFVQYDIIHPAMPIWDAGDPLLADLLDDRPVLLAIDRMVDGLHGAAIRGYLSASCDVRGTVLLSGAEADKTWLQVEAVIAAAIDCHLPRHAVVVGVGGGVTLDISGFASSIYRRGIAYLRVPTTLIGQVDVSVGIKHGVNIGAMKNMIGAFYPPMACINDMSLLATLPRDGLAGGFAEIIKIAMVADQTLFDLVERYGPALMDSGFQRPADVAREIMLRAEEAMAEELRIDLFERVPRRLVDFGHSFSPCLEAASDYALPHGSAVALDMLLSTALAIRRNRCSPDVIDRMVALYVELGLPIHQTICSAAELHAALASVRAHRGGALNLVVPTGIGRAEFLQHVEEIEIEQAMALVRLAAGADALVGL